MTIFFSFSNGRKKDIHIYKKISYLNTNNLTIPQILFFYPPLPKSLPYIPLELRSAHPSLHTRPLTSLAGSEVQIASHYPDLSNYCPNSLQNSHISPSFSSKASAA